MNNITGLFTDIYLPEKALIIYRSLKPEAAQVYVEAYDMDTNGCPINAHPFDAQESALLAHALDRSEELKRDFLTPKGLLPEKVLTCIMVYSYSSEKIHKLVIKEVFFSVVPEKISPFAVYLMSKVIFKLWNLSV